MNRQMEAVIGLEVHAELLTRSKIFCSCSTEFGGDKNTQICPVCTGAPGTLPVLNKRAVELTAMAGLAFNCEITESCTFDRKNYFYPDLPKAFQITQYFFPICKDGFVNIHTKGSLRKIAIKRIHIEEDAGKLLHDLYESETVVDYNRAGVPLIEIVTEPDLRTPEEVVEFLQEVMNTLSSLGISDCRMQEGSLRVDVNISIRVPEALTDSDALENSEALKGSDARISGNRVELKNLNSFKAMKRAINVEVKRQSDIIKSGGKVARETRRWDEASGKTVQMRDKEDIEDYRYFPEPDLPQLLLDRAWVHGIRGRMPELPSMKKERFMLEYGLPEYDAAFLSSDKLTADFFEEAAAICNNAKALSNWIMGEVTRLKKELQPEKNELPFTPAKLAELIVQIDKGIISSQNAKDVLRKMFTTGQAPAEIIREEGLLVIKDEQRLNEIILKVLKDNPKSVTDYRAGRKKAAGFLMGRIMKETGGMADAEVTIGLLEKNLRESRDSM